MLIKMLSVVMERWSGKVVVVTGSSSGIGRSVSAELARNGMKVVALARRKENLEELEKELQNVKGSLTPFQCDVRNPQDIKAAFEFAEKKVGPVSVLINNAGVHSVTPLNGSNMDQVNKILETNVLGLVNCTQEAIAIMKKNNIDNGHIININSICGHQILPGKGMGPYTASKYAVTALSESLRNDLAVDKSKIKVTSISPGLVETEMAAVAIKYMPADIPKLYAKDIADAILYVLQTPPHVNISELTIQGTGESIAMFDH